MIKFLNESTAKKYKNKICVLRIDLNVDTKTDEGLFRLHSVLPTIALLRKHNVRIVIVSHKGRPTHSAEDKKLSLKPFTKIIEKEIGELVAFIQTFNFEEIRETIESAKQDVFLLENIRFCVGEEKNDKKLGKLLAGLGDFYVNDAFAVSHREHASVCAITNFIPSFGGLQLEKEIKNLKGVMVRPESPLVVVLGGAKTSDKLPLIEQFWKKADMFLLGGGPSNTVLAAQGIPMGDSLYDAKLVTKVRKYAFAANVFTPSDTASKGTKILDIGEDTAKEYAEIIKTAKTIIWNGPMGLFEKKPFEKGTAALWKAILANKKAVTVVGGGETIASLCLAVNRCKVPSNIFLSTGGGAMLEYLSGNKLPGIIALG